MNRMYYYGCEVRKGGKRKVTIESPDDLQGLKRIGQIVAIAREEMIKSVKPGITTEELDQIGGRILREYGAKSAPQAEYGFPGYTCISVNHVVAHGIPDKRELMSGDLVNIDVSAVLDGYYADTGASIVVGETDEGKLKLCQCAEDSLYKAIDKIRAGIKMNQIGRVVQNEARKQGFGVIKNLTGHGIGRRLHEEPDHILNYYDKWDTALVKEGWVLAVETFISTGAEYIDEGDDGWAYVTPDKSLVAQYEHTIVVTKDKPIILTVV